MTLFTTKAGRTICLDLLLCVQEPTEGSPHVCSCLMVGQQCRFDLWLYDWNSPDNDWIETAKQEYARLLHEWSKVKLEVVRSDSEKGQP